MLQVSLNFFLEKVVLKSGLDTWVLCQEMNWTSCKSPGLDLGGRMDKTMAKTGHGQGGPTWELRPKVRIPDTFSLRGTNG